MSIPYATTTLRIERQLGPNSTLVDPEETSTSVSWQQIATGVRAHISLPTGSERIVGGTQEQVVFRFQCDLTDVEHTDRIVDETTGLTYQISWVHPRYVGFGLEHVTGGLQQVRGAVASVGG